MMGSVHNMLDQWLPPMINFDIIKDAPLRVVAERFAAFAISNGITAAPRVYAGDFTPVPGYQAQYHLAYSRSPGDEWVFDVNVSITESNESNDWKIRSLRAFFGLPEVGVISFAEFIHAPQQGPRDVDGKTPIIVSPVVADSPIGKEIAPGYFQAAGAPVLFGQFLGIDGKVYQALYFNLATGKENDGLFFGPNAWKRIS